MKIAIISRGRILYSTTRLAETGRKRKHDVRIIDPMKCLSIIDGNGLTMHHDGLKLLEFDLVIPRVGAASPAINLEILRQFELMGVPSLNKWTAIELCRDKFLTSQILASKGFPVPKSMMTCDSEQLPKVAEALGGMPVVTKVTSGTQGVGVLISDTLLSFISTTQTLWSLNQKIFFQQYIAESKGTDVRAFVVNGRVVAAMRRQAVHEDEFRANVHLGASVEPITLDDETRSIVIKAAETLGLVVAGVDVLTTSHGPLILEVNASPGLQGIEAATGVDVAKEIIKAAEQIFRAENSVNGSHSNHGDN